MGQNLLGLLIVLVLSGMSTGLQWGLKFLDFHGASGQSIHIADAQPGDIVAFVARKGGTIDHVAILLDA